MKRDSLSSIRPAHALFLAYLTNKKKRKKKKQHEMKNKKET
jgi:hypothetical protein